MAKTKFFNRELSWIEFNARVLNESLRKEVPLFENDAFREAVINAFVHNKWVTENEPMITVFSVLLPGILVGLASFISSTSHFMSISRGIIDSRDILYFVSLTAVFVSLTVCVISNQRKG